MNVAAILKQKGRAVTTAAPTVTLLEVADKLAAKRIGAIVVVGPRGEVAGIISERDIIRALSQGGPECLSATGVGNHDAAGRDLPGNRHAG